MTSLPEDIRIIFEKNPNLLQLIPRPLFVGSLPSNGMHGSPFNKSAKGSGSAETFFRVVFANNNGSVDKLMAHRKGPLAGKLTTNCVEKGKVSNVAGLEKVDIDTATGLMPALLGVNIYNLLQPSLSYIANLCVDIRNHQITEEWADFETVSEVIVDCFEAIPDLAADESMRAAYLGRVIRNHDDCLRVFNFQKGKFSALLSTEPNPISVAYNGWDSDRGNTTFPGLASFFRVQILGHPVFAAFERLVAGKICELLVSEIYSATNINRHKEAAFRARDQLMELMRRRLDSFDRFTHDHERHIAQSTELDDYGREREREFLRHHISFVTNIRQRIGELLDAKCVSFDMLERLANQGEIEVFVIGGQLLINGAESPALAQADS